MGLEALAEVTVHDVAVVFSILLWCALAVQLRLVDLLDQRRQLASMVFVLLLCAANELISVYLGDLVLMQRLYPLAVIAPLVVASSLLHRYRGAKHLFILSYVIALTYVAQMVPEVLTVFLGELDEYALLLAIVSACMVQAVLVQVVVRPFFIELLDNLDSAWRFLGAMAAVSVCLLMFVFGLGGLIKETALLSFEILIVVCMLGIFAAVVVLHRASSKELASKHQVELARTQVKAHLETEELRAKLKEDERRRRHDMRHLVQVVIDEIEAGETELALENLRRFRGDASLPEADYCRNQAVNSVIRLWASRADEAGIEVAVHADVPSDLAVDSVELSVMFANLLENAFEGCMRLERTEVKRFIDFTCKCDSGRMTCCVRNSCRNDVAFADGMPLSQKRGGGMGTRSIRQTVESHGGMIRYSACDGVFTVQVVMPV